MLQSSPKTTEVAVVIPTHNRLQTLLECLKTVYAQEGVTLQVFVVNDGSEDNTSQVVLEQFPQTRLIEGTGDWWWLGSLNQGIEAALTAGFNYILLVNDDNFLAAGAIAALLGYAQQHPNTVVGSLVLLRETKQVSDVGVKINWLRAGPYLKDFRKKYYGQYNGIMSVDALGGQGVLVPRSVFEKVGMPDSTHYPQYFGDTDFYIRVRQQGLNVVVNPKSVIWNNPPNRPKSSRPTNWQEAWQRFKKIYTWTGSPYNISINLRFFLKHCPPYFLPITIAYRFASSVRYYYLKNWR